MKSTLYNHLHRLSLIALLAMMIVGVGVAAAQPAAPSAPNDQTRVRVAHLAPFAGVIPATTASVTANSQPLGELRYGDRSDYITLDDGATTYQIDIFAGGAVVATASVTLDIGDYSLLIIGDGTTLPLTAFALAENADPPAAGRTTLRFAHVAPFAAALDDSRIDFCTITDVPFDNSSNGLPYKKASRFKEIPAGTYDNLKISYANTSNRCSGSLLLAVPPLTLAPGAITTLYFIGTPAAPAGGLNVFTFEDGIIGYVPEPEIQQAFLPMITTFD